MGTAVTRIEVCGPLEVGWASGPWRGVLSAESINKTITRLGQIPAVAEERDLIPRNPVRVNTRNRTSSGRRPRRRHPPVLQDELTAHRATVREAGLDDLVFPASSGTRVVRPVVKRAER